MLTMSLARGRRKEVHARYVQMAERYKEGLGEILYDSRRGKWTAKRANSVWAKANALGQRRTFGCFALDREAYHFAPKVEHGQLLVECLRLEMPSRHPPIVHVAMWPMRMDEHAVERLFFRLDPDSTAREHLTLGRW